MREHGIDFVRVTDSYYFRKISEEEYSVDVERSVVYTTEKPAYLVRDNTMRLMPFTEGDTIDMKYMRRPQLMVLGQTTADDIGCELDDVLQKIMIGLAMRDHVMRTEAAARAFEWAVQKIEELNVKYPHTESLAYGINRQEYQGEWERLTLYTP